MEGAEHHSEPWTQWRELSIALNPGLLPANCPSSFSSDIPNITYEIEGLISTGPFKFDPFIVTEVISATPSPSVCFDDRTTVGCRLCVSGDVAYTVELPRTSFTVGEEIPVNWYVENGSGRRVTLLCVLREEMVFLASGSQRSARNILSSQSDLTVPRTEPVKLWCVFPFLRVVQPSPAPISSRAHSG